MNYKPNIIAKDTSVIPNGAYCYRHTDRKVECAEMFIDGQWQPVKPYKIPEIQMCPYWSSRADKPDQNNGFCAYLGFGDWEEEGMTLLWDQVKECGVNEDGTDMA